MGIVVKRRSRQRYSKEFKAHTLALIDEGMSPAEVARQQGIREANIYRWRREQETSNSGELQQAQQEIARLQQDNARLRQALKNAQDALQTRRHH
ncbi:transposase [Gilvimarinus sp. DA14]|uniref:transposase n=1 Tax=Gilvimarinus sp. DA14 TaxID=2956798 RepID=UPI0020B8D750|nr:transposase [Gilvimarinus sp. DA14]UTF60601.1 transposase [Gilvimarinus sp. DA14]